MALEAVVFQQDPFNYGCKDLHATFGVNAPCSAYDFGNFEQDQQKSYCQTLHDNSLGGFGFSACWNLSSPSSTSMAFSDNCECAAADVGLFGATGGFSPVEEAPAAVPCRRKRRRAKSVKNKEELENQRMTHIAVERNRRKQMNDYLAALRSMMPAPYVQRGDQASIIGGAINFVKELEQLLQSLEARKRVEKRADTSSSAAFSSLFSDFFSFPQYSARSPNHNPTAATTEPTAEKRSAVANVEVTMVESHANIKILSKKHPKQLLEMVTGLQSQGLCVLHLNVTTVEDMVLYSFNAKVEEDCQPTSVNEIAAAAYEMVGRIQKESAFKLDK